MRSSDKRVSGLVFWSWRYGLWGVPPCQAWGFSNHAQTPVSGASEWCFSTFDVATAVNGIIASRICCRGRGVHFPCFQTISLNAGLIGIQLALGAGGWHGRRGDGMVHALWGRPLVLHGKCFLESISLIPWSP